MMTDSQTSKRDAAYGQNMDVVLLDCTLRDGGYYNAWNFPRDLINDYLLAMKMTGIDYVELGFRSLDVDGFKGGCAFTTDSFIRGLVVPEGLKLGVMVNASELIKYTEGIPAALTKLFNPATESPISLVRLACHLHEFELILPVSHWLKEQGYSVGINLMQIADRTQAEIEEIGALASKYPLDVLYFADSMGSLTPSEVAAVVSYLRKHWRGPLGIHTHDNLGNALANTLRAHEEGVTWLDSTVTGMGRGPGNAKTEYLALEVSSLRGGQDNLTSLLELITKYFQPMQSVYRWGTNPYYYLAGKYGIHPTYIQEMLTDARYSEADILAVIQHLARVGGKKYNEEVLEAGRHFYQLEPRGSWAPSSELAEQDVLILAAGSGVEEHRLAIEDYIRSQHPYVIALNTQSGISSELINLRAACHPVRLLADCSQYEKLPQGLATPVSMLPASIVGALPTNRLRDFGVCIKENTFSFAPTHCTLPSSLVAAYALAIATSGGAKRIFLAGFDGYSADDPRRGEMDRLIQLYSNHPDARPLQAITPTCYKVEKISVYSMI